MTRLPPAVPIDATLNAMLAVAMRGPDAPDNLHSFATAVSAGATTVHFERAQDLYPTAAEEAVLTCEPVRRLA